MTTWDRLVLVFALLLLPWLYWQFWQPQHRGEIARIKHDQHLSQEVSLAKAQTLHVKGELGNSVFATPAICGGRIYQRVAHDVDGRRQEVLYCIGE